MEDAIRSPVFESASPFFFQPTEKDFRLLIERCKTFKVNVQKKS